MTPKMTEAQLQQAVCDFLNLTKMRYYHTFDSRRSQPGFPDLVIVGRGGILYRELKTETGKVSAAQQAWLDALKAVGADARVWRPEDLNSGTIWREIRRLISPGPTDASSPKAPPARTASSG